MPWDQASFRKHNRALSPGQSAHAARIANAILKRTGDEGLAIATANARVKKRAAGGGVGQSDPMQAAFDAIAAARTGAQQYAQGVFGTGTPSGQSPAGGGGVSQSDAIQAGYDAIAAAHAGAQQYARDVFAPPGGSSGQSPAGQSPAGPLPQAPSYLAGTAGSPVNLANLPRYSPQVPSDMGINSAGFMNTPQTGDFSLDPMTGALTPGTQAALRTLAQRGLNIGGQQAGAPAASAQPSGQAGQPGSGPEGAGNAEVGGVNAGVGGGNPSVVDIIGGQGPSFGFSGTGAKIGAGIGSVLGPGPRGPRGGAPNGGAIGGFDPGTSQDPGAQAVAGDLGINALGAGLESGQGMGDITGGGQARGGRIKKRANGGGMMPMGQAAPWFERNEARNTEHPSGLINSPIGGRSDHIPLSLPHGSYVMPADIMSGMGQGNTASGAHQFDAMIHQGPFGTSLPMPKLHGTLPRPPSAPRMVGAHHFSRGGRTKGLVPVIVAGGERIVSPEEVMKLSGKSLEHGHALLDDFIVKFRKHNISVIKRLPGPQK
jgi:hypothetical protein